MGKHTPGPWKASTPTPNAMLPNEGRWNVTFAKDEYGIVAILAGPRAGHDARLIAAAPELLEALELAAFAMEGKREDSDPTLSTIRAAIAKAKGEE